MGLTIHYSLKIPSNSVVEVRKQVERLRQVAADLPFQNVSELKEFKGKAACDYTKYPPASAERWFLVMASHENFVPTYILGFDAIVGSGCESLDLAFTKHSNKGWTATGFCKTQYASNPDCGGLKNFVQCHLTILQLMNIAKKLGFQVEVTDEGHYWEKRDLKALVQEIGEWNTMLAGFAGTLQDVMSKTDSKLELESEITKYPNFEHLEAEGTGDKATPAVKVLQKKV